MGWDLIHGQQNPGSIPQLGDVGPIILFSKFISQGSDYGYKLFLFQQPSVKKWYECLATYNCMAFLREQSIRSVEIATYIWVCKCLSHHYTGVKRYRKLLTLLLPLSIHPDFWRLDVLCLVELPKMERLIEKFWSLYPKKERTASLNFQKSGDTWRLKSKNIHWYYTT